MAYRKPKSVGYGLTLQLLESWNKCERCPIAHLTSTKVLPRGNILDFRIEVVFIGEAPGNAEDATGLPFIGPSGKLLDKIIKEVQRKFNQDFTYALLNTVACTPYTGPDRAEIREPLKEEMDNCRSWVDRFINLKQPLLVVCVGKHSESVYLKAYGLPTIAILHPAYLLRQGGESSIHYKRTVLKLTKEVQRVLETGQRKNRKRKTIPITED